MTDVLQLLEALNSGDITTQLNQWFRRVTNDVNMTGAKGEVGIKLKLAPVKDTDNILMLTASISLKTPKNERDVVTDSITDDFTLFVQSDKGVTLEPNEGEFDYE